MMHKIGKITTEELFQKIDCKNIQIVDVRSVNAYNGWRCKDEMRGGHIKGARSLPVTWVNYLDWKEIVLAKKIFPQHEIIVYAYTREDAEKVVNNFIIAGYTTISIYDDFVDEWSSNHSLPMQYLPRYNQLVSAHWVYQLSQGVTPENYHNDKFIIVHAHYRNRNAYLSGHIPGAIDMDTLALESPETWNRRSPVELKAALEAHGITADTTVVLYGKFMAPDNNDDFPGSAAGHIGAIRIAMIMMYAGVKDVRVLNGGFQSWKDAGFAISKEDVPHRYVSSFGVHIPAVPEIIVDISEAKKMIQSEEAELVCVRSWPEYIGEVSGYNYIEKKGRIPGVVFGNCGTDAYHMENYRNIDHTTREAQEIEANWLSAGLTPDKHLAFYCGTGWRGSEAWFNAWLLGWPKVSVFDGGWFEWSKNPDNPYETGVPAKK